MDQHSNDFSISLFDKDNDYGNSGSASMGYGLPASIGAGIDSAKNIYCIEGDG